MPNESIQKPNAADASYVRKNVINPLKKKKKPVSAPSTPERYNPSSEGNRYPFYEGPIRI